MAVVTPLLTACLHSLHDFAFMSPHARLRLFVLLRGLVLEVSALMSNGSSDSTLTACLHSLHEFAFMSPHARLLLFVLLRGFVFVCLSLCCFEPRRLGEKDARQRCLQQAFGPVAIACPRPPYYYFFYAASHWDQRGPDGRRATMRLLGDWDSTRAPPQGSPGPPSGRGDALGILGGLTVVIGLRGYLGVIPIGNFSCCDLFSLPRVRIASHRI